MFQLIVAAISIFLVALLTLAAFYFCGPAFNQSQVKAEFSQYLQEGTQIQAGYKFGEATAGYTPSGSSSDQFKTLVNNKYLSSIPNGGWVVQDSMLYRPLSDLSQCGKMNQIQGYYDPKASNMPAGGCPACSDTNYSGWFACQSDQPIMGDTQ